jgi:hypothetical protein
MMTSPGASSREIRNEMRTLFIVVLDSRVDTGEKAAALRRPDI